MTFPADRLARAARVLICGIGFSVLSLGLGVSLAEAEETSALTVAVETPQRLEWQESVPASGWLAAWQEAIVGSEIGGLSVTDILVDVGAAVTKGQTLATLSQASALADLHKQEASVESAKASLAQAKANADRARKVTATGAYSEQQITEYLIAEQTATATLAQENASLESERIKLQQTTIVAPDDGIVSSRSAMLGSVVSSGTELFRLIRQNRVEWQAEIPAQSLSKIRQGLTATIDGPQNAKIEGKVRLISPNITTSTGRAIVYVALAQNAAARVGLYASGQINVEVTPALTVPERALVFRDGINYVFTVGSDNRVSRLQVDVGRRLGGRVEILSRLAADARVVQSGGAFLSNGSLVRVSEAMQ